MTVLEALKLYEKGEAAEFKKIVSEFLPAVALIGFDWNDVMRLRDMAVEKNRLGFLRAFEDVWVESGTGLCLTDWLLFYSQPQHIVYAALTALKGDKE